jgi:hypothetical protein
MSRDLLLATAIIGGAFYLYETQINSSVEPAEEPAEEPVEGEEPAEQPVEGEGEGEGEGEQEQDSRFDLGDALTGIGLGIGIGLVGDKLKAEIKKKLEEKKAKAKSDAEKKKAQADLDAQEKKNKADAEAKKKAEADVEAKKKAQAQADLDAKQKATLKTQADIDASKPKTTLGKAPASTPVATSKTPSSLTDDIIKKQNALKLAEANAKALAEKTRLAKATADAQKLAKATKTAEKVAKASKLAKLGKLAKATPWGILFTALTMSLSAILDLGVEDFNPCDEGDFDFNSLPMWAKMIIEQVPFVGDVYSMFGDLLCASDKCGDTEESGSGIGAGFCYQPCNASFRSDGATLCYKQYPTFENNGQGHTITSITKKITLNTGKPLSTCSASEDKSGLLCYPKCRDGMKGVGPVCWADTIGVGIGTPVQLEDCPSGWSNDGLTCREPLSWDGCCRRGLFNECYGCLRGGNVVGRLNNGGKCGSDREKIDGLCYNRCPAGWEHVAGMPYNCKKSGVPLSEPRGAGSPMKCAAGEKEIAGLCYNECPSGSVMQSLGLCSQSCPAGANDFGVGCTREAYNRGAGRPKITIKIKSRAIFRNFGERVKDTFTGSQSGREATSFIAN